MKKLLYILFILLLLAGSFLAGSWYSQGKPGDSEKPGLAPGSMKMEPVYADANAGRTSEDVSSPMPPGTVRISPEKQQLIGVRIGQAEKTSGSHILRTLGRVVIDENRIYRLITPVEGWVKEIHGGTTGSIVEKDQVLAHFYSRDILTPQQAYFYALNALDRFKKEGLDSAQQVSASNAQIRSAEEALLALGMGEAQIKEIAKTRQATRDIEIRAPVSGLVLQRNIYPKLRFERGTEWYRIADLSSVWILADIFENEGQYLRKGTRVQILLPHQKKLFHARVSDVLPQFDATTRTLKVRLEADNPDFALRPDMFVDAEIPIQFPHAIAIPTDAILDSGIKKTVFVDHGNGMFEPREVETGWRMGNRVEIVKGLKPGERIVISGNFLIDSESKLAMAASGMQEALSKDLVCGMEISLRKAEKEGLKSTYRGESYFFCSQACRDKFEKAPKRFIKMTPAETSGEKVPPSKTPQKTEGHDHS
jgi:membrane fusion protein, copper/silver efflux system